MPPTFVFFMIISFCEIWFLQWVFLVRQYFFLRLCFCTGNDFFLAITFFSKASCLYTKSFGFFSKFVFQGVFFSQGFFVPHLFTRKFFHGSFVFLFLIATLFSKGIFFEVVLFLMIFFVRILRLLSWWYFFFSKRTFFHFFQNFRICFIINYNYNYKFSKKEKLWKPLDQTITKNDTATVRGHTRVFPPGLYIRDKVNYCNYYNQIEEIF